MNSWLVDGASVIGESHVRRGRPNDDAIAIEQSGNWTAVVLSDGAGSAKRAREGSNLVAGAFCSELLKIANLLNRSGPGPWLNDAVINGVLEVRRELAENAGSYDLKDFHCTLVAVLISDRGGFIVHIGDGTVLVGRKVALETIEYGVYSYPENGEYANETFFITEETWLKNIRIKPLGECEWVILTTDGAAALLLDKDVKCEVIESLLKSSSDAAKNRDLQSFLEKFLNSPYAKNCSNDDKTLAILFKQSQSLLYLNKLKFDKSTIIQNSKLVEKIGERPLAESREDGTVQIKMDRIGKTQSKLFFRLSQVKIFLAISAFFSIIVIATFFALYFFHGQECIFCIFDHLDWFEMNQGPFMRSEY